MEEPAKDSESAPQFQTTGRHLSWSSGLVGVFLVLALYVLSTGPVCKIAASRGSTPRAYVILYEPLSLLCTHCRPVDKFFNWYILDFWRCGPPQQPAPASK